MMVTFRCRGELDHGNRRSESHSSHHIIRSIVRTKGVELLPPKTEFAFFFQRVHVAEQKPFGTLRLTFRNELPERPFKSEDVRSIPWPSIILDEKKNLYIILNCLIISYF